jgi:hypothetical protein
MADTTMFEALAPVVVGGVLTLVGGFGAQWWFQRSQAKAEKQKQRAAKFLELMDALYQFDDWLDQMRNYRVVGRDDPKRMSPFPRVRAICSLYFPEFSPRVNDMGLAADDFQAWMFKAAQKRFDAGGHQVFSEGHVEARHEYAKLFHQIVKDLEAFAQRELQ